MEDMDVWEALTDDQRDAIRRLAHDGYDPSPLQRNDRTWTGTDADPDPTLWGIT
jgi:hypothetical protein